MSEEDERQKLIEGVIPTDKRLRRRFVSEASRSNLIITRAQRDLAMPSYAKLGFQDVKWVIYARFSSRQQSIHSIERQEEICRGYFSRMGVSVAAIFSDLATRGTTSKRKGWDEMWRFCEEHKNTQIAIESMSRATRNGIAYAEWIHNRVRVGATIHSVSNGGPLTEFQEQLFSAIANHDYISATTQMRNQKILAAERGVYMGKAPYGTFKDKEKLLHPDPETAPIVKEIFEWAASGYRIVDIVNMLQARNILGPNGRLLDRDIVIYILQNTAYKGLALFTPPVFEFERRSFDYIFER